MPRKPSLRKQIDNLLNEYDPIIQKAFIDSIADVRSQVILRVLVERLERRDIEGAIEALTLDRAAFGRLETAIAQAYNAGGTAMVGRLPTLRDASGSRLVVRFDSRIPRAEQWVSRHGANLVSNIIDDQVAGLRTFVEAGLRAGANPNRVALDIIGRVNRATGRRTGGLIGLTGQQSSFVASARDELLSGDASLLRNYLTRGRRDRSFDGAVRKAIVTGKPIDRASVDRMTGRYADRLLQLRGETIARTEALSSIHAGKMEGFRQGLEKTNYPPEAVTRVWRSAGDGRVRHTHAAMDGQEVQGLNTPFQSPSGAQLMHPGDTSLGAGAEEIINCRCDSDLRIDFSFGVE